MSKVAKVGGILHESLANGPGVRMTIFFQGCGHKCEGCHNQHLWDYSGGVERSVEDIICAMSKSAPIIDGITLSGGEPFDQAVCAKEIAAAARQMGLSIWAYTGYSFEDLQTMSQADSDIRELLACVDTLVDGKYLLALSDAELQYRGSKNQRIIELLNGSVERVL